MRVRLTVEERIALAVLLALLAGATVGAGIPTNNVAQFIADWDAFNAIVGRKVP